MGLFTRSASAAVLVLSIAPSITFAQQYLITTVAGGGVAPTAVVATGVSIGTPSSLAADSYGSQFFIENNCVFKVDVTGILTRFAGTGSKGYSGDAVPAISSSLNQPSGLAVDKEGNVYIGDGMNYRIRKVAVDGTITTVVGTGSYDGYSGDGGPGIDAQIGNVTNVAVDSLGDVYFDDYGIALRKLTPDGIVHTVLNNFAPITWTVDTAGNVFEFKIPGNIVQKISSTGTVTAVAGNGTFGSSGDGGSATKAGLAFVSALAVDAEGNLLLADLTSISTPQAAVLSDSLIREVSPDGTIRTIAGNGESGYSGDGGPALSAALGTISALATDPAGNLYLADNQSNRIRKIAVNQAISTIAGNGAETSDGDGGQALAAQLFSPSGVTLDLANNIYVSDQQRVRKISVEGTITTVAGNGIAGYEGDGGQATDAELTNPEGLAVDAAGNLYISDSLNQRIRRVGVNGTITTFAGNGIRGFSGDGGPATGAQLNSPEGVALDAAGNVFVLDNDNARIREVALNGQISTVAGMGKFGFSGDGGPATLAEFSFGDPGGLAIDGLGNLYIADAENSRVRKITANGIVSTLADNAFGFLAGIALDASGNVFVADGGNGVIDSVAADGTVTTIHGTSPLGISADGAPPSGAAGVGSPDGIVVSPNGTIYFTDAQNKLVRALIPPADPVIAISAIHQGSLYLGKPGATYQITVRNLSLVSATTGEVSVSFEIPNGLALVSAAGIGSTCTSTCNRSDALAAVSSYPPITLTVNVSPVALSQLALSARIAGGGAPVARSTDLANIYSASVPSAPLLYTPANRVGGQPDAVTLSWAGTVNDYYDVYLGTTPNPPLVASVSGPNYTPATLTFGTVYYWFVVARNPTGAASSAVSTFATDLNLQTINFTPIAEQTYGGAAITLIATSSVSAPIMFTVVSGPAVIAGNSLTLTGIGQVTVQAVSPAVPGYTAALSIQTFKIASPPPIIAAVLNSASFKQSALTPASLRTLFGQNLANQTAGLSTAVLPTVLEGTSVMLLDGSGQSLAAQLLYVSPAQINFVVPLNASIGAGTLSVTNSAGTIAFPVQIGEIDPGIFSVNSTGSGLAVGSALHVMPDGTTTYTDLATCGGTPVLCVAIPIVFGSADERIFLVFYGTGVRGVSSTTDVSVTIAGTPLQVLYAGPQGQFVGLDQINAELSRALVGAGPATVQFTVAGQQANPLGLSIQ